MDSTTLRDLVHICKKSSAQKFISMIKDVQHKIYAYKNNLYNKKVFCFVHSLTSSELESLIKLNIFFGDDVVEKLTEIYDDYYMFGGKRKKQKNTKKKVTKEVKEEIKTKKTIPSVKIKIKTKTPVRKIETKPKPAKPDKKQKTKSMWSKFKEATSSMIPDEAKEAWKSAKAEAKSMGKEAWKGIKDIADESTKEARDALKDVGNEIGKELRSAQKEIMTEVKEVGKEVGKEIGSVTKEISKKALAEQKRITSLATSNLKGNISKIKKFKLKRPSYATALS